MQLQLRDHEQADALAAFLRSLGQFPEVVERDVVELTVPDAGPEREAARLEVEIYLRVWQVLRPDAEVLYLER
jgi:hypothetical protein